VKAKLEPHEEELVRIKLVEFATSSPAKIEDLEVFGSQGLLPIMHHYHRAIPSQQKPCRGGEVTVSIKVEKFPCLSSISR
jgi:hypothetical protein